MICTVVTVHFVKNEYRRKPFSIGNLPFGRMSREKFNRMNKALVHWDDLIDGIQQIADEHDESGWKTLVLHPGDVSIKTSETGAQAAGFQLVVPESELDSVGEIIRENDEAFDEFEVHRASEDNLLYFAVSVKSSAQKNAVFFPVYYDPSVDQRFVTELQEQDTVFTDITNLGQTRQYSFEHHNPNLFSP